MMVGVARCITAVWKAVLLGAGSFCCLQKEREVASASTSCSLKGRSEVVGVPQTAFPISE